MTESNKKRKEVPSVKLFGKDILKMIELAINEVDDDAVMDFVNEIIMTKVRDGRIFLAAQGRSRLIGETFIMRLLHLGFEVHVVGRTTTPPIRQNDAIILISGSGRTRSTVNAAEVAKKIGAKTLGITTNPEGDLVKYLDVTIIINVKNKESEITNLDWSELRLIGAGHPIPPMGSLFEDTTLILLESVVTLMMEKLEITESDMKQRHANVE